MLITSPFRASTLLEVFIFLESRGMQTFKCQFKGKKKKTENIESGFFFSSSSDYVISSSVICPLAMVGYHFFGGGGGITTPLPSPLIALDFFSEQMDWELHFFLVRVITFYPFCLICPISAWWYCCQCSPFSPPWEMSAPA